MHHILWYFVGSPYFSISTADFQSLLQAHCRPISRSPTQYCGKFRSENNNTEMLQVKSDALWMMTLLSVAAMAAAQPLSTSSRWIVNESTGERVKLACLNWVAHLEVVVAEGLSKQPMDVISRTVRNLGFNCVRLTWPLFLMTNDSLASVTVRESFFKLGLTESIAGMEANNPSIIDLSLINAFEAVVASIASNNVMIILDNHISKPGWCCNVNDGNGFFGDQNFNPDVWIRGLTKVATMFKGVTNVVGMSLRNELRGPNQNVDDWYRYMQQGAEAVHAANPKVLTILSGLIWDSDLSFLHQKAVNLSFTRKLVFEVHWYSFSNPGEWEAGSSNEVCGRITESVNRRAGYLLDQGYPLFVSEFGVDQRGTNVNEHRYLNCFMGWAAENDLDWALWTLVGSYYFRQSQAGMNEYYGVYDWYWNDVRNSSFLQRISALQTPFQGAGGSQSSRPHKLIFHPATGLCVQKLSLYRPVELGPCSEANSWIYSSDKVLTIMDSYFCLQADSVGKPAKLGLICTELSSKWELISDSKMHLASKLHDGSEVCLDVDSDSDSDNNIVVTNTCRCLNSDIACDPVNQWFRIINSSRPRIEARL